MLAQTPAKPNPPPEGVVIAHANWLKDPTTQQLIRRLEAHASKRYTDLLAVYATKEETDNVNKLSELKTLNEVLLWIKTLPTAAEI